MLCVGWFCAYYYGGKPAIGVMLVCVDANPVMYMKEARAHFPITSFRPSVLSFPVPIAGHDLQLLHFGVEERPD